MDLERFVNAQQRDYATALAEIHARHKESHWMWYIFPQLQGLGYSETSRYYAIRDAAEARAYLQHPIMREHLVEISQALLQLPTCNANQVMGRPDDLKLKSSMTLFALVSDAPVFQAVLDKFFHGQMDEKTVRLLGAANTVL